MNAKPAIPSEHLRREHVGSGPANRSARYGLGFWSLVVTQFQGAFNDNALKFLVIYLVVGMNLPTAERNWLVLVVGALFALPFILFSMTGGYLADRFSKRSVTIGTKWMEVGVMVFALVALARGDMALESAGVFLLSSQAAIFGPSKYGLLPELLPEKDLSWGNGVIELGTFLAAISATVAAGFLAYYFRGRQGRSAAILLGCTVVGLATSFGVSRVPAANPARKFELNPLSDLGQQLGAICSDRVLSWAMVGNFYLWFLAALLQFTIVIYGHDILRIDERHISYLQAAVAIGIGLGSLATGYLSDAKIEYGLIPVGAVGMTVFGFLSAAHGISLQRAAAYLGLLGFFGGFYAVPLSALIQHRPDPARKGGIIAAANLTSFVGVFAAAGIYFALAEGLKLRADQIFFAGACMTLLATLYAVVFLPDCVTRFILWMLTHSMYRVRVDGRDNIPERGSALFVARDLALQDVIFLSAATDRSIHFVADPKAFANTRPLIRRALRITSMPETSDTNRLPNQIAEAFARGDVVCIAVAVANALLQGSPEPDHLSRYLLETGVPIVPIAVEGSSNRALQTDAGRWRFSAAHLFGRVIVRFGAPFAAKENTSLANALTYLKAMPELRFSGRD
jgi:acyl-[acyl-carrier-protein]-phospholipid O-acyltransferase / long-chain-fatty-acid--[acyl-carrier-protein] ligase